MTETLPNRRRVILMCCDGPYQRDLATRIHCTHDLLGVVKVVDPGVRGTVVSRLKRMLDPLRLTRHVIARVGQQSSAKAAFPLFEQLFCSNGGAPAYPYGVPVLEVSNVNELEVVTFVRGLRPDVICVNGTNLLRRPMLDLIPDIPYGIINLHTGLSPYTRGGNCNLYALLEGHPEWVGVTVHHIDAGIDSGDLIRTAQVPMDPADLFDHIDIRTFRLGNDLLVESIERVATGQAPRVKQWQAGRLYLRRTGFVYEPWHWHQVNLKLREGLVRRYLETGRVADRDVRLVDWA